MRSCVLDQNTHTTGFAIGEESRTSIIAEGFPGKLIRHGRITIRQDIPRTARMVIFKAELKKLLQTYGAQCIAIEFTNFKNQKSGETNEAMAALTGACREVAMLLNIPCYFYHGGTIKKEITGKGNATKETLKKEVCNNLGWSLSDILDDNHSDALAAFLVWLRLGRQWRQEQNLKRRR